MGVEGSSDCPQRLRVRYAIYTEQRHGFEMAGGSNNERSENAENS
jgi:hypothetical protein